MVKSYFDKILTTLYLKKWVKSVQIVEYDITENDLKHILIYRLRVRMKDDDLLEIMERICFSKKDGRIIPTKYKVFRSILLKESENYCALFREISAKILLRIARNGFEKEISTHLYIF